MPDAARLVFYRPGFYGARAKEFTHEAMRGPSAWSVADRELMAAYVEDGLRATLRMLGKLTAEGKLSAEDMREVLSAGVSPDQVTDALAVCAAFNTTGRLADALPVARTESARPAWFTYRLVVWFPGLRVA